MPRAERATNPRLCEQTEQLKKYTLPTSSTLSLSAGISMAVGQAACAEDDQQRRQVSDEHRQHVLQAEGDRLGERYPSVQGVGRRVVWTLVHGDPPP